MIIIPASRHLQASLPHEQLHRYRVHAEMVRRLVPRRRPCGQFFGTVVILDEAYRFLKMVGLVPNASANKGQDTRGQSAPDATSEANKLSQTGSSTSTLKSRPGHGQGDSQTISSGRFADDLLGPSWQRASFSGDLHAARQLRKTTSRSQSECS